MIGRRLSVLLATENGYPFYRNDAGRYADTLVSGLPDVDFTLLAVTPHPYLAGAYTLPANVSSLITVPLGGMEDPAEYGNHASLPHYVRRRWSVTDEDASEYAELYAQFLRAALRQTLPPRALGVVLLRMHIHLRHFDYHRTQTDAAVWQTYLEVVRAEWAAAYPAEPAPSAADVADGWRVVYRALLPLAVDVPETDLTHATSAGPSALPCTIAKLRHHTPGVIGEQRVWLRDQYLDAPSSQSPFVRWISMRLMASIADVNYAYATRLTPASDFAAAWATSRGAHAHDVEVIRPGVAAGPLPQRNAQPTPAVVAVGDFQAASGHIELIEAAALLRREFPGVRVRITGAEIDRQYAQRCRDLVNALGLANTVTLDAAEPATAAAADADVAVFPHLSGAVPYALLDAMMAGVAVLAADVGALRDAVGDTAMLAPAGDAATLSQSLLALLRSPESRRRLGEAAHERARELFTDDRCIREYRGVYERLLDRPAAIPQTAAAPMFGAA